MRRKGFLLVLALWVTPVLGDDNAGVYFFGTPPTAEEIATMAAGAEVEIEGGRDATSIDVDWPEVSVVITIRRVWDRERQLAGMKGWLAKVQQGEAEDARIAEFVADLEKTKTAYGVVISPGYDRAGKVAALLKRLVRDKEGFFFSHQSFYDANGKRVVGLAGDPPVLGPK